MNLSSLLKHLLFYNLFVLLLIAGSCSSDDDTPENGSGVFFQEAKLSDFPLNEVPYLDIDITHPEVVNGTETRPGKIRITIPFSQTSLRLSLKQFHLDQNKY